MQLFIFIAGIVLLAIDPFFGGQDTVGWALVIIAGVLTVIQLALVGFVMRR